MNACALETCGKSCQGKYCSRQCSYQANATARLDGYHRKIAKRVSLPYLFEGEMVCSVALSSGETALISAEDAVRVGCWTWRVNDKGYVISSDKGNPRQAVRYLHRFILKASTGIFVDHRHGNKLDNRRSQLRFATNSQNQQNRQGVRKGNTTGYRNVQLDKRNGRYAAGMVIQGKYLHVGKFDTAEQANQAAIEARRKHMIHASECA